MKDLKKIRRYMTDVFFPRQCPVCKEALPFSADPKLPLSALICRDCICELSFINGPVCKKCGKELSEANQNVGLCNDCQKHIRLFSKNVSVLNYTSIEREILADLKYRGKREYAEPLALIAAMYLEKSQSLPPIDVVVAVPVHKERLKKRGYDQAALLARAIAGRMGLRFRGDILIRSSATKAQKELGYEDRILNLQHAFSACIESDKEFKRILIVDDIYTTGATLEICTEALLQAGAKEVYGCCIASGRDE